MRCVQHFVCDARHFIMNWKEPHPCMTAKQYCFCMDSGKHKGPKHEILDEATSGLGPDECSRNARKTRCYRLHLEKYSYTLRSLNIG